MVSLYFRAFVNVVCPYHDHRVVDRQRPFDNSKSNVNQRVYLGGTKCDILSLDMFLVVAVLSSFRKEILSFRDQTDVYQWTCKLKLSDMAAMATAKQVHWGSSFGSTLAWGLRYTSSGNHKPGPWYIIFLILFFVKWDNFLVRKG